MKISRLFAAALALASVVFSPKLHAADEAPSVDAVLDQYVKAIGGKAAVEKLTSRRLTADFSLIGNTAPWTQLAKAPNKRVSELKTNGFGDFKDGFDGTVAWVRDPNGVREKEGMELARARIDSEFQRDIKLKEIYPDLNYKRTEKLDGKEVHVLESKGDHGLDRFFFDTKTGFLVRQQSEFTTGAGLTLADSRLSDYREVEGIKYPFEHFVRFQSNQGELDMQVKVRKIEHNIEIDDAEFAKPSA